MLKGLLGSVAALAAGAGLAFGQPSRSVLPAVDPPPAAAAPGAAAVPPAGLEPGALPPGYTPQPNAVVPPGFDGPGLFGYAGDQPGAYHQERAWASFEYLLWRPRTAPSNWPLAVQGTLLNGVNPFLPGAVTLFGGSPIDFESENGARFTAGAWLPGSNVIGVEASLYVTEVKSVSRAYASGPDGIPVLGIPFINENTGAIDGLLASTLSIPGRISASATNQNYGAEINMVANVYRRMFFSTNILVGFRQNTLEEGLDLQVTSAGNPNGFFNGAANTGPITLNDRFNTRNYFYGGQLGFQFEYRFRALYLDYDTRIAMGVMHRMLDVNGTSTAGAVTVPGGLFAATTNMGTKTDNDFGVIPQIHLAAGWQAAACLRFFVGFDFMYMTSVVRPGDQIDNVVNPALVPFRPEFGAAVGTARPAPRFVTSDYWTTGVSFGMTLRY
jgi:hypothetical protein